MRSVLERELPAIAAYERWWLDNIRPRVTVSIGRQVILENCTKSTLKHKMLSRKLYFWSVDVPASVAAAEVRLALEG